MYLGAADAPRTTGLRLGGANVDPIDSRPGLDEALQGHSPLRQGRENDARAFFHGKGPGSNWNPVRGRQFLCRDRYIIHCPRLSKTRAISANRATLAPRFEYRGHSGRRWAAQSPSLKIPRRSPRRRNRAFSWQGAPAARWKSRRPADWEFVAADLEGPGGIPPALREPRRTWRVRGICILGGCRHRSTSRLRAPRRRARGHPAKFENAFSSPPDRQLPAPRTQKLVTM